VQIVCTCRRAHSSGIPPSDAQKNIVSVGESAIIARIFDAMDCGVSQ